MTIFYIIVLVLCIWLLVKSSKARQHSGSQNNSTDCAYPYRPEVEFRLPNGRITTNGYAAQHPAQFTHWMHGPNNVYGENIDLGDWEDWRINYYGE